MSEQILSVLNRKLDELSAFGGIDAETRRNFLKEELQFYVLNFIYHHPEYSKWIMYGGSALRIIHELNRMSVDLDFEVSHAVTNKFLEELKKEVGEYFVNTYGASEDFLTMKITNGRGLLLKFQVGQALGPGHPSNQVHVKIDLNHFVAPKTVTERRPINHGQLSFVILTYNMSSLMASKLAAIFLRGTRGVGKAIYDEKGRDIYDLLWYMGKKAVPDFDYLKAKGIDANDPKALFDQVTMKILHNPKTDENLKNDLSPLFLDQSFISHWLRNWRESYHDFLKKYKIRTVTALRRVRINEEFKTDNLSFIYFYDTEESETVSVLYTVAYEWIEVEKSLGIPIDSNLLELIEPKSATKLNEQAKQFLTLFHQKTEKYFKKTNRVMVGDGIVTKVIKTTSDNLNLEDQILLDKSALLECELNDLIK